MLSIYQAYQSYERRARRGEFAQSIRASGRPALPLQAKLSYRLGDLLVRVGMKLKHQPQAGHGLMSTGMAGR